MTHPRARVYYHTYLPGESHPDAHPLNADTDLSWREDATIIDFVHDRHSRCETVQVETATDEAVQIELQKRHPAAVIVIDKISWLEYTTAGP